MDAIRRRYCGCHLLLCLIAWLPGISTGEEPQPWSAAEKAVLQSLWIDSLGPVPPDPSNAVADNPGAARLGQRIFFDTRFSGNGAVACATCHQPALDFTDGLARSRGMGETQRTSMSLVGAAYSHTFTHNSDPSLLSEPASP